MSDFLIAYDLRNVKYYDELHAFLRTKGAEPVQWSVWKLKSGQTAGELFAEIRTEMLSYDKEVNDRLAVAETVALVTTREALRPPNVLDALRRTKGV